MFEKGKGRSNDILGRMSIKEMGETEFETIARTSFVEPLIENIKKAQEKAREPAHAVELIKDEISMVLLNPKFKNFLDSEILKTNEQYIKFCSKLRDIVKELVWKKQEIIQLKHYQMIHAHLMITLWEISDYADERKKAWRRIREQADAKRSELDNTTNLLDPE